jgi:thiamine kinase-like enzyme
MDNDGLLGRLARLPCWRGTVTFEPLKGGLSNLTFVASDKAGKFVVRCGHDIPVHHVFRERERAASRAAHAAGLAPELVYEHADITVLRFVEGRAFEEKDVAANVDRIVSLLKICHREVGRHVRGPVNAFWVFHVIRDYVRLIGAESSYAALADKLERSQVPLPIVFGHHDLLAGNLIDDGSRLWLIDWEYGGFGTAMFDLANLSSNGNFAAADDVSLLDAYFDGKVSDELRTAFAAMKAASVLREALWAMVSDVHLRTPGVDYQAHAREYLKRLDRLMGG